MLTVIRLDHGNNLVLFFDIIFVLIYSHEKINYLEFNW